MRTPKDPSFVTVSWVIQWRKGPQDAQVGPKLVPTVFQLLIFQKPTFNIVCLLAPLTLLPTPDCDSTAELTVGPDTEWQSGHGVWSLLFVMCFRQLFNSIRFPGGTTAPIRDIHKEEAPKTGGAPGCCSFCSSSKLTKINLDLYLDPYLHLFPSTSLSICFCPLFFLPKLSLFLSLHFCSLLTPATLSLVPFFY